VNPGAAPGLVHQAQAIIDAVNAGQARFAVERPVRPLSGFSASHAVADLISTVVKLIPLTGASSSPISWPHSTTSTRPIRESRGQIECLQEAGGIGARESSASGRVKPTGAADHQRRHRNSPPTGIRTRHLTVTSRHWTVRQGPRADNRGRNSNAEALLAPPGHRSAMGWRCALWRQACCCRRGPASRRPNGLRRSNTL